MVTFRAISSGGRSSTPTTHWHTSMVPPCSTLTLWKLCRRAKPLDKQGGCSREVSLGLCEGCQTGLQLKAMLGKLQKRSSGEVVKAWRLCMRYLLTKLSGGLLPKKWHPFPEAAAQPLTALAACCNFLGSSDIL